MFSSPGIAIINRLAITSLAAFALVWPANSANASSDDITLKAFSTCPRQFATVPLRITTARLREIAAKSLRAMEPVTATNETRRTELFSLKTFKDRMPVSGLHDLRELKRGEEAWGLGFYRAYKASIGQNEVFAKVSPVKIGDTRGGLRTIESLENEVAWVRRLDELGIGPKFHGVVEHDRHYILVTDWIEGFHYSGSTAEIPKSFQPTRELIESLKDISATIEREGINAYDFQMRISERRAYVIDPEEFRPAKRRQDFDSAQKEIRDLIEALEQRLH